ncbi:hypothetical protein MATL_G00093510 [Megalops atlanticus]|uniref:Uncharacterized protein n=1 Tax=Megalops atlanticus TaxID=7932 RepID=A0A9D3Q2E6_MEGAT|nr:hypothetical protein MATL_G00093510 [Megalops atlanticus]
MMEVIRSPPASARLRLFVRKESQAACSHSQGSLTHNAVLRWAESQSQGSLIKRRYRIAPPLGDFQGSASPSALVSGPGSPVPPPLPAPPEDSREQPGSREHNL